MLDWSLKYMVNNLLFWVPISPYSGVKRNLNIETTTSFYVKKKLKRRRSKCHFKNYIFAPKTFKLYLNKNINLFK